MAGLKHLLLVFCKNKNKKKDRFANENAILFGNFIFVRFYFILFFKKVGNDKESYGKFGPTFFTKMINL